jgi:uncharacterized Tic20 family protein
MTVSENLQVSKEEQNWAMFCHLAALSGFVLMFIVALVALILTIIAAVNVSNGQFDYKYPLTLRLIK